MKKILTLLVIVFCQVVFAQEDYSKFKPVEPLYDNGGISKFYEYLSKSIDLSKFQNEKDVIIAFILGKDGKMNHIKVGFCSNTEAEKEITSALQKANNWDLSNQKDKDYFICYKIKLIFSDKEVNGLTKTFWFKQDIPNITIDKNEFFKSEEKLNIIQDDNIYNIAGVDIKPEYPGGIDEFYKYIMKNFRQTNDKNFKGGKIFVMFVVDRDGSLTDIKVRDIGFGTKEEAIRLMKNCKKWIPAAQNGVPVRCSYMLPIILNSN